MATESITKDLDFNDMGYITLHHIESAIPMLYWFAMLSDEFIDDFFKKILTKEVFEDKYTQSLLFETLHKGIFKLWPHKAIGNRWQFSGKGKTLEFEVDKENKQCLYLSMKTEENFYELY